MNRKQTFVVILVALLLAAATAMPGRQMASGMAERLANGSFEEGFASTPAGLVGNGWGWFHSGGTARYGFYQDQWAPVVYDGGSSQLIEINTGGYVASDPDHYAGIYQTVAVVPGSKYTLTVKGMLRALEEDPDRAGYSYRVQYGLDYDGGSSWEAVDNWVELPWDTVHPRLSPGPLSSFSADIVTTGKRLTIFVRAWYKWGTVNRELDVNLDAISLVGAAPEDKDVPALTYSVLRPSGGSYSVVENTDLANADKLAVGFQAPQFPVAGWAYVIPVQSSNDVGVTRLELYDNGELLGKVQYRVGPLQLSHGFDWQPAAAGRHVLQAVAYDAAGAKVVQEVAVRVSEPVEFLTNGSFETGFRETPAGIVGSNWGWFHNGGRAAYGFYDDTWGPIVADGLHSQLIEINTFEQGASDPDRYSGLMQTVDGLTEGATYKFSLRGMLRVAAKEADTDPYSYRVEWGYTPDGTVDWNAVANWTEIPWNIVYSRLDPGDMDGFTTTFEAPSTKITLFIRAWKKWGTADRELDVNLDGISLTGYK